MIKERYADGQFLITELMDQDQPDPYCSALLRARTRAAESFTEKYGIPPYWERCILEIHNSPQRVSLRIKELNREESFSGKHPALAERGKKARNVE